MSKSGFSIEHSGRFKTGQELRSALADALGPSLKRAGLVLEGGIKREAPVRTGNLRRSVNTSPPHWRGAAYLVEVGPNTVYAARVNRTSKKNRGYIKRGIDASKSKAKAELVRGARSVEFSAIWKAK